jgi:hypothetical protein
MLRKLFVCLGVFLLCAGGLRAGGGYRASVEKIDLARKVIVVKAGEKERPIRVVPGVVLRDEQGKGIDFEAAKLEEKGFRKGRLVTVTFVPGEKGMNCVIQLQNQPPQ